MATVDKYHYIITSYYLSEGATALERQVLRMVEDRAFRRLELMMK